jgi:signal transduction histidine kinase
MNPESTRSPYESHTFLTEVPEPIEGVAVSATGRGTLRGSLCAAAEVLKNHLEEIITAYEERLIDMESPLVTRVQMREQIKAQARSVLKEVAVHLRGQEGPYWTEWNADPLSESIGTSTAEEGVHVSESLLIAVALSEAALSVVVNNLPSSRTSRSEVAAVAVALQKSILKRVARESVAYGNWLLDKLHEAHADERRRISRELHDRVAHSIMVLFRNLELYELYQPQNPYKAQAKLDCAKKTAQETLRMTRNISSELRNSSAAGGLQIALSDYLRSIVTPDMEVCGSIEGDESLIAAEVRDELFLILREAVRNSVTHSGARKIAVEIRITRAWVRASVEDDGRGLDLNEVAYSSGTGLASMRERTALLGGTLSLASTPGSGTTVKVYVPLPRRTR